MQWCSKVGVGPCAKIPKGPPLTPDRVRQSVGARFGATIPDSIAVAIARIDNPK